MSRLGKLLKKVNLGKALSKIANNKLIGGALSFVPGGTAIVAGAKTFDKVKGITNRVKGAIKLPNKPNRSKVATVLGTADNAIGAIANEPQKVTTKKEKVEKIPLRTK